MKVTTKSLTSNISLGLFSNKYGMSILQLVIDMSMFKVCRVLGTQYIRIYSGLSIELTSRLSFSTRIPVLRRGGGWGLPFFSLLSMCVSAPQKTPWLCLFVHNTAHAHTLC